MQGNVNFSFRKTDSKVAYCALGIKSGTRNEPARFGGLAHFTEHMIFKGTLHRTCSEINSTLESLGGELNAYTTKEETVLYATVLKEDLPVAADLLFDLAFCPRLDGEDMKKEKTVVLDEIASYKDSPSDEIFDEFEKMIYDGHPLGGVVLGTARSLGRITPEVMSDYVAGNFIPQNISFAVVGDFEREKVEQAVEAACGKYLPQRRALPAAPESIIAGTPSARCFEKSVNRRNHQSHCVMGRLAPSLYDERRYAYILLANMLGGPASSSILNDLLREQNALVYNVEANYTQYSDTGLFTIYFGCDRENLEKCLELVSSATLGLRTCPVAEETLSKAKRQLLGQMAISADNGETQALSMVKSLMAYGRVEAEEASHRRIAGVTVEDLLSAAREALDPEGMSSLIYR